VKGGYIEDLKDTCYTNSSDKFLARAERIKESNKDCKILQGYLIAKTH
jgi:hypothetical protein